MLTWLLHYRVTLSLYPQNKSRRLNFEGAERLQDDPRSERPAPRKTLIGFLKW